MLYTPLLLLSMEAHSGLPHPHWTMIWWLYWVL